MRLHDGTGRVIDVKPGLVDKEGLFLLLLDDHDAYTRHFMFSGEADLIESLLGELRALERAEEKLHDKLDTLADKNDELRLKLARALEHIEELEQSDGGAE